VRRGRGKLWGLSQWVQLYTGAQINYGDLTPNLTYDTASMSNIHLCSKQRPVSWLCPFLVAIQRIVRFKHGACCTRCYAAESKFYTFKQPKDRFQGTNSARRGSLTGRYDNYYIPTRFQGSSTVSRQQCTVYTNCSLIHRSCTGVKSIFKVGLNPVQDLWIRLLVSSTVRENQWIKTDQSPIVSSNKKKNKLYVCIFYRVHQSVLNDL
jgi:hypothetical protein